MTVFIAHDYAVRKNYEKSVQISALLSDYKYDAH